jgi:hypothetical protein
VEGLRLRVTQRSDQLLPAPERRFASRGEPLGHLGLMVAAVPGMRVLVAVSRDRVL